MKKILTFILVALLVILAIRWMKGGPEVGELTEAASTEAVSFVEELVEDVIAEDPCDEVPCVDGVPVTYDSKK